MILTSKKIEVSYEMLERNNMTRLNNNEVQVGVPLDLQNPGLALIWKNIQELEESDYDMLEDYFLSKQ